MVFKDIKSKKCRTSFHIVLLASSSLTSCFHLALFPMFAFSLPSFLPSSPTSSPFSSFLSSLASLPPLSSSVVSFYLVFSHLFLLSFLYRNDG